MYFAGIKLVDIAKELKVPEGTIRSWKNRYKWDCNVAKTERNAAKNAKRVKKVVAEEVENVTQNTKLTDKQQLFCLYYIRSFNATKAYQKAYGCNYHSAMQNGSRLLKNDKVKNEIFKMKQEKLNREFLSESDVFQKYIDIAFADITDYLEFGTEEIPVTSLHGPVKIIDPDTGEEKQLTKIVNKVRFKDSAQLDGTILAEVKQGKEGASIKLADRMKALQWLSEHMDMATTEQKLRMQQIKNLSEEFDKNDSTEVVIYLPDNERDDT
ncbi:MAG: phage portal protein [Lachnospiraceae bacterium]|nr:phage portal protein [Lachnospiraceae bacterium]